MSANILVLRVESVKHQSYTGTTYKEIADGGGASQGDPADTAVHAAMVVPDHPPEVIQGTTFACA